MTNIAATIDPSQRRFLNERFRSVSYGDKRWVKLRSILLGIGGEMIVPVPEPDLAEIIARGKHIKAPVKMKTMRQSACHKNAAKLCRMNPNYRIMTGWALSDDGLWRQHSWVLDKKTNTIIETTELREAYFGIELEGQAARDFIENNPEDLSASMKAGAAGAAYTLTTKAIDRFGLTSDPKEAGYILIDGRMLDFSGKKDGGESGRRAMDHREVVDLFEGPSDAMDEFMRVTGAIRFSIVDRGMFLDFRSRPTPAQISVIRRAFKDSNIDFVEIDSLSGHDEVAPATWPLVMNKFRQLGLSASGIRATGRKSIVFDFDGTIAEEVEFPEIGEPRPGIIDLMRKAKDAGIEVVIQSCRWSVHDLSTPEEAAIHRADAEVWLAEHDVPYDRLVDGKPLGEAYVDDKAIGANDLQALDALIGDIASQHPVDGSLKAAEKGDIIEIPLSKVLTSMRSYEAAWYDNEMGRGSKSKGPLSVWVLEDGRFLLTDGQHRFAKAVKRGDKTIKAEIIGEGYSDYWATPEPGTEFVLGRPMDGSLKASKKLYKLQPITPEDPYDFGGVLPMCPFCKMPPAAFTSRNKKGHVVYTIRCPKCRREESVVGEPNKAKLAWTEFATGTAKKGRHIDTFAHMNLKANIDRAFFISPDGKFTTFPAGSTHAKHVERITGHPSVYAAEQAGWADGRFDQIQLIIAAKDEAGIERALNALPQEYLFASVLTWEFPPGVGDSVDIDPEEDALDAWKHRHGVRKRVLANSDFNQRLRYAKKAIYQDFLDTLGYGPLDGGCVVFAQAVQQVFGGEIVSLLRTDTWEADHAAVRLNGELLDADGSLPEAKAIERFAKAEGVSISGVRPFKDSDLPEAGRDADLVKRTASRLTSKVKASMRRITATGSAHSWGCLMMDFPDDIAKDAIAWAKANIPDEVIYDTNDHEYGRETNIHTTVAYGIDPKTDLDDLAANLWYWEQPVKVKLGKVSKFEQDGYDVIKVDVDSHDLHDLNRQIEMNLGLPGNTFPDYKPHLTLAYVKPGSCDHLMGETPFAGREFELTRFDYSYPPEEGAKDTHKKYDLANLRVAAAKESPFTSLQKAALRLVEDDPAWKSMIGDPASAQALGELQRALRDARSEEELQTAWEAHMDLPWTAVENEVKT